MLPNPFSECALFDNRTDNCIPQSSAPSKLHAKPCSVGRSTISIFAAAILFSLLLGTPGLVQAADSLLILGGSQAFSPSEAPFPVQTVATHLKGMVKNDPALVTPVSVEARDTYRPATVKSAFAGRSLMAWYYWPEDRTNTLSLLRQGWSHVVLIEDPYIASRFPEYAFEGARAINSEVRPYGTQTLMAMTWSSGATPINTFDVMTSRVARGIGAAVVPAGYAWDGLAAGLRDSGSRPTERGAYVTACAIYSRIYRRSAKSCSYLPSGMTSADRDTIADSVLATVLARETVPSNTATYVGPTHFATPLNRKRTLTYTDFNSSTELGYRVALTACTDIFNVKLNGTFGSYQSLPATGYPYDLCLARFFTAADPTSWTQYATFDYQDNSSANGTSSSVTMTAGIDRVINRSLKRSGDEQETGASDIDSTMRGKGAFFLPVRVAWSRLITEHPEISPQPDGHHLSSQYNFAIASMMYTLLSGRCPIGDEPSPITPEWLCRKYGYEIAWQYATLKERVPGFEVRPSLAADISLVATRSADPVTVRFLYPPTAPVTVAITISNAAAGAVDHSSLLFTPENYATKQTILISGRAVPSTSSVTFNFTTSSDDPVFSGLSDDWTYDVLVPPAPTLSTVKPISGPTAGATTVTITGTNLIGTTAVSFGGTAATGVKVVNATTVTCDSPAHAAGSVDIVLTAPGGMVTKIKPFSYLAAPVLTTLSPNSGPATGGTTVKITGANLLGTTAVSFGGIPATNITVVNATTVTCVAPAHAAGLVDVAITTPGGTVTKSGAFTMIAAVVAPVINTSPMNMVVPLGGMAKFTVTATGVPKPTYQWLKNGTAIPGATDTTYTIPSVSEVDQGTKYSVTAINSAGTAVSSDALLTVMMITDPMRIILGQGIPAQIALHATGSPTSFTAVGLPSGLSLSPTGLVSGTPTIQGTTLVEVTARNIEASVTARITIDVLSPVEIFIRRFYEHCLNRSPDAAGLSAWSTALINGSYTGVDVARGFILSPEFINRNLGDSEFLDIVYRAFFGREPDAVGKASWQSQLSVNVLREDVLYGFIFSQEFTNLCQLYVITAKNANTETIYTVRQFVRRFYQQCLNREPDAQGIADWTSHLIQGTRSGSDVAQGFMLSQEFSLRSLSDQTYLNILYKAFFDRDPDMGGNNRWLAEMAEGKSRQAVLNGFIHAQEFSALCARYGIIPFATGG